VEYRSAMAHASEAAAFHVRVAESQLAVVRREGFKLLNDGSESGVLPLAGERSPTAYLRTELDGVHFHTFVPVFKSDGPEDPRNLALLSAGLERLKAYSEAKLRFIAEYQLKHP